MTGTKTQGFSVVIPTFQEAANIPALIERMSGLSQNPPPFEVILVDDNSQDGIVEVVERLKFSHPWLKLVVRIGKKGLSEAVIEGFKQAQFDQFVVMDADLSHPPEKIPEMLSKLNEVGVDMVVGSRYISGGSTDAVWPLPRKLTSKATALIANWLLSINISDPLSGFLAIKRETYAAGGILDPIGWKIGLEMMVRCHCRSIQEIPIHFSNRLHGESKLSPKTAWQFIQHIQRLLFYKLFSK